MLSCTYNEVHILIKLGYDASKTSNARRTMTNTKQREDMISKLERGFNPRNIAVVGAARHNEFRWLKSHLAIREHNGDVFHVNIDENEWPGAEELGVKNFKSMLDIPEPIDYVTISVPRKFVPLVVQDCIKKEVALVHIFTAGFEESGEEEGIMLDDQISKMARDAGLLIMGPNCMGLFNPSSGVRQGPNQYHNESGNFGYISQSGSMATGMSLEANAHGIKMSKCISMGNGMIVDVGDYMDYFMQDDETQIVGMYIEGLKEPARFFKDLKQASTKKPILVWKVGLTEDSARATAAHTGSAFIPGSVWAALMARCGAIPIESQDEMIDTAKALTLVSPPSGFNVGMYASTGGHSTDMANVFSKHGFKVVPLTDKSYEELRSFFNMIGGNYVNPIQQAPPEHFERIVQILSRDDNVDIVALELPGSRLADDEKLLEDRIRILKEAQSNSPKTVVACLYDGYPRMDQSTLERVTKQFAENGIATFHSFQNAAVALRNVANYHIINRYTES